MKKFDGYLIASDIDGTLTDEKGQISRENADAIRYFQSEGGRMTVASGRFPSYIEKYADVFVPNTCVIGINGTMLYDPETKTPVIERPLDDGALGVIHESITLCPQIKGVVVSSPQHDLRIESADFDRMDEILTGHEKPWFKAIFLQDPKDSHFVRDTLKAAFGNRYRFDMSWAAGLELHVMDSGKGEMVKELRRLLTEAGHPIHTVVCVGDYENDISMLEAADIAYAVENAVDEVKAAADRITVSHRNSAIASIIGDLENDMKSGL